MDANTTRSLARILIAADRLPEPARHAALVELWAARSLDTKGQRSAVTRWRIAMATWPAA